MPWVHPTTLWHQFLSKKNNNQGIVKNVKNYMMLRKIYPTLRKLYRIYKHFLFKLGHDFVICFFFCIIFSAFENFYV